MQYLTVKMKRQSHQDRLLLLHTDYDTVIKWYSHINPLHSCTQTAFDFDTEPQQAGLHCDKTLVHFTLCQILQLVCSTTIRTFASFNCLQIKK